MFYTVLYQPLFNLLIWLYNILPGADIGFAIIALTVLIKSVLWPFSHVALKGQRALQEIQPKIEALKVEYKDDKEKLAKAMMELYQKEKVNPFSSCLPLLIQIPILIALYRVLMDGLQPDKLSALYSFVSNPGSIQANFLGLVDLSKPSIILALLAGAFQFWQTRMLVAKKPPTAVAKTSGAKDEAMLASMNKSMVTFMPIMTVVIGVSLPGGLTLYWVAVNLISIAQQYLVFRKKKHV